VRGLVRVVVPTNNPTLSAVAWKLVAERAIERAEMGRI